MKKKMMMNNYGGSFVYLKLVLSKFSKMKIPSFQLPNRHMNVIKIVNVRKSEESFFSNLKL